MSNAMRGPDSRIGVQVRALESELIKLKRIIADLETLEQKIDNDTMSSDIEALLRNRGPVANELAEYKQSLVTVVNQIDKMVRNVDRFLREENKLLLEAFGESQGKH